MNDMERRKFEDDIQKAFAEAEVTPSGRVWTGIELDLVRAEGEKMKRRVFFYQMLAAASISFAVLFAGVGYYALQNADSSGPATAYSNNQALKENADRSFNESRDIQREGQGNGVASDSDSPASGGNTTGTIPAANEQARPGAGNDQLASNDESMRNPSTNNITDDGNNRDVLAHATDKSIAERPTDAANSETLIANPSAIDEEMNRSPLADLSQQSRGVFDDPKAANTLLTNMPAEVSASFAQIDRSKLPAIHNTTTPEPDFSPDEVVADPVQLMFARLNDLEKELSSKESTRKESRGEKLWTSVGFAAGAFNSVGASSPSSAALTPNTSGLSNYAASSVAQKQSKASGMAYTVGVSVGTRLSERWVLQGGFNYLTQMSDYTSTQAVEQSGTFKAASVNQLRSEAAFDGTGERFIPTAPYTVNNSNEFVSIPLQAGYLLVKRRVIWQLNAGFATDLFVQNTIDPEGNIEKTTSNAGSDSPFRTVNFSGLVGSEISYRLGERYRLGVNPGIRYPFSSIYKEDIGLESTPVTFDVGVRFRYIFR